VVEGFITGIHKSPFHGFSVEFSEHKLYNTGESTRHIDWKLLQSDFPANIKKTLFSLYQSVAVSEAGKEHLFQIWKKEKEIKNLFLNENDFTALAMKLAIYEHPKSVEIIEEQQTRITNKERLERFKWLIPSLSKDRSVRDFFMKTLLEKENREKESWVETALSNIHHPLRQNLAIKHLKPILEKLEEVQITGDIFFPKGWLANSIGKYSSAESNTVLQDFLNDNPNYNPILLKKLLQTTDNLTRAQSIKK
jgi:aminopeptidase N